MTDLYFMNSSKYFQRGRVSINHKGRLTWVFLEHCEDGFTFLSKPAVLIVRLQDTKGITQKIRVLRFRKQKNLDAWVSYHIKGLREEGYDVSYMD